MSRKEVTGHIYVFIKIMALGENYLLQASRM